MTTEGSFVLGGGVFARLLSLDINLGICAFASLVSGLIAGCGVSFIQSKEKINSLIAGIIGLFLLYTLNFKIMGRPNIAVPPLSSFHLSKPTIFALIILLTITIAILMATRLGLVLRAFGNNAALLKSLGKNIEVYRSFGLALSNMLSALCGAITAFVHGFADLGMGFGMTLTGISTVMIGQQLQRYFFPNYSFNIFLEISACFVGVMIYFLAINGLLTFGLDPIYLKFVLGLVLILLLRYKLKI